MTPSYKFHVEFRSAHDMRDDEAGHIVRTIIDHDEDVAIAAARATFLIPSLWAVVNVTREEV